VELHLHHYHGSMFVVPLKNKKQFFRSGLKFSKNSGMIVYRYITFCKNFNFFNEASKYIFRFNSITATLI
jgi:hypothetical protein